MNAIYYSRISTIHTRTPKRTTTTSRYNRKSAGRLDYPGVDTGDKRFKGPSDIALKKLAEFRALAKQVAPKGRFDTRAERNSALKDAWAKHNDRRMGRDLIEQEDNLAKARAMSGVQFGGHRGHRSMYY